MACEEVCSVLPLAHTHKHKNTHTHTRDRPSILGLLHAGKRPGSTLDQLVCVAAPLSHTFGCGGTVTASSHSVEPTYFKMTRVCCVSPTPESCALLLSTTHDPRMSPSWKFAGITPRIRHLHLLNWGESVVRPSDNWSSCIGSELQLCETPPCEVQRSGFFSPIVLLTVTVTPINFPFPRMKVAEDSTGHNS